MITASNIAEWGLGLLSGSAVVYSITASAQGVSDLPLDLIGKLGAGGLVTLTAWFFLRRDKESKSENDAALKTRDETIKTIAADFSATSTTIAKTFAETTTTLMRESRAEALQREENLREIFESLHKDKG